jgi:hypothetical protein
VIRETGDDARNASSAAQRMKVGLTIFPLTSHLSLLASPCPRVAGTPACGLPPNGVCFLAGRSAGRAKLLLSRIPAASISLIPAASQKTLATAHIADRRSAARQEPRPPESSPVFSPTFRELQRHWAVALRLTGIFLCLLSLPYPLTRIPHAIQSRKK